MTKSQPQRTNTYESEATASVIWDRFETRADDVFVCTPPKSGTTWMQTLCGMLIFGDPAVNPGIGTTSRWLDSQFNDEEELLQTLQAQKHRRYIKTHTPLDGITYDPRCTYIPVYRHPLDVGFSVQNHMKNMKSGALDHFIMEDVNSGTKDWIERPFGPNQEIGETLESLIYHFTSFMKWRAMPNIHIFHYEEMKADLSAAVKRLADLLGYDIDADQIAAVAEAATFSNMKSNAEKYAPSADRGIWKDTAQFFESGSSNKWAGVLSDDVLELYAQRMDGLLSPQDRAWLEHGSTL